MAGAACRHCQSNEPGLTGPYTEEHASRDKDSSPSVAVCLCLGDHEVLVQDSPIPCFGRCQGCFLSSFIQMEMILGLDEDVRWVCKMLTLMVSTQPLVRVSPSCA